MHDVVSIVYYVLPGKSKRITYFLQLWKTVELVEVMDQNSEVNRFELAAICLS